MLLLTGVDFGETSVQDVVVVDTAGRLTLSVIISWRLKEIKEMQVTGDRRRAVSRLIIICSRSLTNRVQHLLI